MSEHDDTTPVATDDRLDLTKVIPVGDRELGIAVVWRKLEIVEGVRRGGPIVAVEPTDFKIPGRLPIPVMTRFLRLEAKINQTLARDDDIEADHELEGLSQEAHDEIVDLVLRRSPRAFEPRELGDLGTVVGSIELEVDHVLITLAWIAGDTSVANRVTRALTAGRSEAKTEEEVAADFERAAGEHGTDAQEAADRAPLASRKR